MIEVLNGKTDGWLKGEYVGRGMARSLVPALKTGSVLGNPFKPKASTPIDHAIVCDQYKKWLWWQISNQTSKTLAARSELQKLKQLAASGNVKLLCWCAPLPCHADVLKSCIEWAISNDFDFVQIQSLEQM